MIDLSDPTFVRNVSIPFRVKMTKELCDTSKGSKQIRRISLKTLRKFREENVNHCHGNSVHGADVVVAQSTVGTAVHAG